MSNTSALISPSPEPSRFSFFSGARRSVSVASTVEVIKEGWLWKQGGARGGRKSWKRRYFKIKEQTLFYYKSAESDFVQGLMPLKSARLLDFAGDQEKPPPEFKPGKVCHECKHSFGYTRRKHHCRNCGRPFCDAHCSQRIEIPKYGYNIPVRVCEPCFEEVLQQLKDESRYKTAAGGKATLRVERPSGSGELTEEDAKKKSAKKRIGRFTLPTELKPHLFALKNSERELWMHAESAAERVEWVKAIHSMQHDQPGRGDDSDDEADGAALAAAEATKDAAALSKVPPPPERTHWEVDFSQVSLIKKVGKGAFGEVFQGRVWGTDIAVKTLNQQEFGSDDVLKEIRQEVEILSKLRHPNVVLYIGACTTEPNLCILTEWCDRGSLYDVLHDHSVRIDAKLIINIAMGVAQGMNYLHSLEDRIIHRDLKSHNILVDKNFTVKVADFGLSQMKKKTPPKQAADVAAAASAAGLAPPASGDLASVSVDDMGIFGTPEWMAPEVMLGERYTEKIDVYSYGILLTELVTRQMPFHDIYTINGYMDVVDAVLDDGAIPTIPKWCDTVLTPLIERCLSRNPVERPTFTEITDRLRHYANLADAFYFVELDIPRLREQMMHSNPQVQAMASAEIAALCAEQKITRSTLSASTLGVPPGGASPDVAGRDARGRSMSAIVTEGTDRPRLRVSRRTPSFHLAELNKRARNGGLVGRRTKHGMDLEEEGSAEATFEEMIVQDNLDPAALEEGGRSRMSSVVPAAAASADGLGNWVPAEVRNSSGAKVVGGGQTLDAAMILDGMMELGAAEAASDLWRLDDDDAAAFLERFSALLTSTHLLVQLAACRAISSLLSIGDRTCRAHDRRTLIQSGALTPLLSLLRSRSSAIQAQAGRVLLELTNQLPQAEMDIFLGQDEELLRRFNAIVGNEVRELEHRLAEARVVLSQKNALMRHLDKCAEVEREGKRRGEGSAALSRKVKPVFKRKPSKHHMRFSSNPNGEEDDDPYAGRPANISTVDESGDGGGGVRSRSAEDLQTAADTSVADELKELLPERAMTLTPAFKDFYPFARYFDTVLRYDEYEEDWKPCFMVLGATELRVFDSQEDEPDDPHFIIRVKTPQGQPTKVQLGEMHGKPFCFSMEDCGYGWFFCARTAQDMLTWDAVISGADANALLKKTRRMSLPAVDSLPEHVSVPEEYVEWYGEGRIKRVGYVLVRHMETWRWEVRYAVMALQEIKFYLSASDEPEDPLETVFLTMPSGDPAEVLVLGAGSDPDTESATSVELAKFAAFQINADLDAEPAVICCRNVEERDEWVSKIRSVLAGEETPAAEPESAASSGGDAQGMLTASAKAAAANLSPTPPKVRPISIRPKVMAVNPEWAVPFDKAFGKAIIYGYLHRRRRISGRWIREFFHLVGSELRCYKNHMSDPKRAQLELWTCTASGKPFEIQVEPTKPSDKKQFVFSIANPSGTYTLACKDQEELNAWMIALHDSIVSYKEQLQEQGA